MKLTMLRSSYRRRRRITTATTLLSTTKSSSSPPTSLPPSSSVEYKIGYKKNNNKSRTYPSFSSSSSSSILSFNSIILISILLILILIDNTKLNVNASRSKSRIISPCNIYDTDKSIIEPFFEIYTPYGIRISLPSIDIDMNKFEFHGNVNELISLDEEGVIHGKANFSQYWGQWSIFLEYPKLKVGDYINYWYEIKINDEIKRFQKSVPYLVKYLIPVIPKFEEPTTQPPITTTIVPPYIKPSCEVNCNSEKVYRLDQEIKELKFELNMLQEEIQPILNEIASLKRLLSQYYSNTKPDDRKLLLTSAKPIPYQNAIEEVRFIVVEKLRLYDFKYKIVDATYQPCGILFEMATSLDKQLLLSECKYKLNDSPIKILEPFNGTDCSSATENTITSSETKES